LGFALSLKGIDLLKLLDGADFGVFTST
jgi:hypothetical protein